MKLFSIISGILFGISLFVCIGYAFYVYGIPYLDAQSEYTKNIPSIEVLTDKCELQEKVIDSLYSVTNLQTNNIEHLNIVLEATRAQLSNTVTNNKANQEIVNKLTSVESQLLSGRVIVDTVYIKK